MVTICTKIFCKPTIQERLLSKKRKNNEDIKEYFANLEKIRAQRNSKILSGTYIPNSTFRRISAESGNKDKSNLECQSQKSNNSLNDKEVISSSLKSLKKNHEKSQESSLLQVKSTKESSLILLQTSTLEELKNMRDLLNKSSYVPKQVSSRRPTIEKIKSAIREEKKHLTEKNKSETEETVLLSDATTSTEGKKKKKIKRKKKSADNVKKPTNSLAKSIGTSRYKIKKKIIEKVSVDIQCSLYKDDEDNSKQI
ncbi:uncharacterized protein LOC143191065 [Rhynchophorus ferrugineus]|uniref:uncharacterized protein LOC143191065 n=1 Tax=Rhynchophorus ferrugineus TaxID=354439 RepID=UPI003FCDD83F